MKNLMSFAVFCLTALVVVSFFSCSAQTPKANLKTDVDSLSYAYGITFAQGLDNYLQNQGYEGAVLDEFFKGFSKGSKVNAKNKKVVAHLEGMMIGKQLMDMYGNINGSLFGPDSTATQSLNKSQFLGGFLSAVQNKNLRMQKEMAQAYTQTKSEEIKNRGNEKLKIENLAFLEDNKTKQNVITLPSGLQYKVEKEGTGPKPTADNTVKVKYRGTDIKGKEFDSNNEAVFELNRVIRGWTEGIPLMSVGSKYTFYIPYDLAYGERGSRPNIEPYATLIFDVELLDIVKE